MLFVETELVFMMGSITQAAVQYTHSTPGERDKSKTVPALEQCQHYRPDNGTDTNRQHQCVLGTPYSLPAVFATWYSSITVGTWKHGSTRTETDSR